jgi:hypothetical protein
VAIQDMIALRDAKNKTKTPATNATKRPTILEDLKPTIIVIGFNQ